MRSQSGPLSTRSLEFCQHLNTYQNTPECSLQICKRRMQYSLQRPTHPRAQLLSTPERVMNDPWPFRTTQVEKFTSGRTTHPLGNIDCAGMRLGLWFKRVGSSALNGIIRRTLDDPAARSDTQSYHSCIPISRTNACTDSQSRLFPTEGSSAKTLTSGLSTRKRVSFWLTIQRFM